MSLYTAVISLIFIGRYMDSILSKVEVPELESEMQLTKLSEEVLNKTENLNWLIIHEGKMIIKLERWLTNNKTYMIIDDLSVRNTNLRRINKYSFLIIIKSVEILRAVVTKLRSYDYWNCNSIFIIINLGNDILLNEAIFLAMWESRILNVLIINLNLNMFTYRIKNCGEKITTLRLTQENITNVMNNSMIRNFEKCAVRVIAMKHPPFVIRTKDESNPGINIVALRTMAAKANFTIKYVEHNVSNLMREFNETTLYRLLYLNEGDVLIILTISEHYNVFDISGHFLYMNFATYYQNPGQLPVGILIFKVYGPIIWCLLGVSIIALGSMLWLGSKNNNSLFNSILIIYSMLLTSLQGQPKPWSQRLIFLTWAVSAFFLLCSYSSVLISLFSVPAYTKPYDSLAQMINQNYNIGSFSFTKTMFQTEKNKDQFHWFDCPVALQCLKMVYDDPKTMYIMSSRLAEYYMAKNFTRPSGRKAFIE